VHHVFLYFLRDGPLCISNYLLLLDDGPKALIAPLVPLVQSDLEGRHSVSFNDVGRQLVQFFYYSVAEEIHGTFVPENLANFRFVEVLADVQTRSLFLELVVKASGVVQGCSGNFGGMLLEAWVPTPGVFAPPRTGKGRAGDGCGRGSPPSHLGGNFFLKFWCQILRFGAYLMLQVSV